MTKTTLHPAHKERKAQIQKLNSPLLVGIALEAHCIFTSNTSIPYMESVTKIQKACFPYITVTDACFYLDCMDKTELVKIMLQSEMDQLLIPDLITAIMENRKSKKFNKPAPIIYPEITKEDVIVGDAVITMVNIPAGDFIMGSSNDDGMSEFAFPPTHVTLKGFQMSETPITQAQWRAVAALPQIDIPLQPNPSRFPGDNRPVERVSWYEAVEFCKRLSVLTGEEYDLPSESQWEYACRARTTTPFYTGQTLNTDQANFDGSGIGGVFRQETTPVKMFLPNQFGLYDMLGNVWEWCKCVWYPNHEGAPTDGSART